MARFVIICYILIRVFELESFGKRNGSLLFFIISVSTIYLSGSREALYILLALGVVLNFNISQRILIFLLLIFFVGFILSGTTDFGRLSFMFSTLGDLIARIVMLMPIFRIDPDNLVWFSYLGLGTYGRETVLDPVALARGTGLDKEILVPIKDVFVYQLVSFEDAAVTKIYAELGIFGIILFLGLWLRLLIKKLPYAAVKYRMNFLFLMMLILVLKSHQILSDIFFMVTFYSLVLGSFRFNTYEKS